MDKSGAVSSTGHQRGVLIEADLVVLSGMERFFDVCVARLAKEGIKLSRDMFLRFLFGKSLARGMASLLEKTGKTGDAPALVADCSVAYLESLQKADSKARDGVLTFAKDVAARGVKVGLITQLPEELAKQVFADVLDDNVVTITETPHNACLHGWEGWRRAARKLQVGERLCVAISSPASARGALAASMRLAVVLDPMQEHFDCGGADLIVESFTPAVRTAALGLLKIEE
ncbi:MAG: hypothetical protein WCR06_08540 [bacterium]